MSDPHPEYPFLQNEMTLIGTALHLSAVLSSYIILLIALEDLDFLLRDPRVVDTISYTPYIGPGHNTHMPA